MQQGGKATVIASQRLNRLLYAINRRVHRWGMHPFPFRQDANPGEFDAAIPEVFDAIYRGNLWGSEESASGTGSERAHTEVYRKQLVELLRRRRIGSMFDASCGDLNWMPLVLAEFPALGYVGGDVSREAVARALARCPHLDIRHFDLCRDPFPKAQLWHCRHTLFHLPFAAIRACLENAARSEVEWVLLTTHRARMLRNQDIESGNFRLLDLERAPFGLPPAQEYLADFSRGQFPRYSGLWRMDDVRRSLK